MTRAFVGKYVLIDADCFWNNGYVLAYNDNPWLKEHEDEQRFFIVECHDAAGNTEILRLREGELELDPYQDYEWEPEEKIDWGSYHGRDLLGIKVEVLRPVRKHGFIVDYSEDNDTYCIEFSTDPYIESQAYFLRKDFEITEDNE